ncbi:MAG: hypothetical protein Q4A74_01335 [Cardiobacteriaceae bacterium]|nr:hypothetical protein [Cardiobacteriaceae bacterium]
MNDNGLTTANWQLVFTNPTTLRDTPLFDIAKRHRSLRVLVPQRFLASHECKWTSSATLYHHDKTEHGHALYETVYWKK